MNNTLNKFKTILGNDNSLDDFITLFEMPDEQFDKIYSQLNEKLDSIFNQKSFQNQVLEIIESNPINDFNEEKKVITDFIDEIKADDSISDNKKNLLVSMIEKTILSVYDLYTNPRERIKVKIVLDDEKAKLPTYAHDSDAGADVYSVDTITVEPGKTVLVSTGIRTEIPLGYEIQLRPRSGMSAKTPMRIANSPATIDANFRGVIKVIMHNTGNEPYTINTGDRIAQMVIMPVPMIEWEEVNELSSSDRGEGGYGSTGV